MPSYAALRGLLDHTAKEEAMDTLADTSACKMRSEGKNRPVYQHIWVPGPEDIVIDHAGGVCQALRG
jgi:hypothetical protein